MQSSQPEFHRSSRTYALAILLLGAAVVALAGLRVGALETHEIFVVQTAQEMRAHGEWIVPTFGGELRLTKPPLNYWLTRLVADITGAARVEPWHGRLPSALAGVWLVWLIWRMGLRLFSPRAAWLGAGLLLSSLGWLHYIHNARPEMVYAALCTAGLAGWIERWKRPQSDGRAVGGSVGWAYAAWLAMGLATLTKGPHIPGLMAVGLLLVITYRDGFRVGLRVLRPEGVLIAAAAAGWWWVALHLRVPDLSAVAPELGGQRYRVSPLNIFSPYYFYRPLRLLLPWAPLMILLIWLHQRALPVRQNVRLLLAVVVAVLLGLSAGGGPRDYYALPVVGLLALATAAATVAWRDAAARPESVDRLLTGLLLVGIVAVAGLAVLLGRLPLPWWGWIPAAGGLLLLLVGSFLREPRERFPVLAGAWMLMLATVLMRGSFDGPEQNQRALAAITAGAYALPYQTLQCYVDPAYAIYYAAHPVVDHTQDLPDVPLPRPGEWMLVPDLDWSAAGTHRRPPTRALTVATIPDCDNGDAWLVQLVLP